jgi:hypothetical protein
MSDGAMGVINRVQQRRLRTGREQRARGVCMDDEERA